MAVQIDFAHTAKEVLDHPKLFGGKSIALAKLTKEGFSVPQFLAVGEGVVRMIAEDELGDEELLHHIKTMRWDSPPARYAVRSSAIGEDGAHASHAGEFLSVVDIPAGEVANAITTVVEDAKSKGYATKDRPFSLIIQEFIAGDVAGVVFTRNPLSGREAVCEWRRGGAQGVVGGAPVSRVHQNADAYITKEHFPQQSKLFTTARSIEDVFNAPQDIEWVVKGGALFVLQSRPITTIGDGMLAMYRSIDAFTKEKDVYLYTRSGIGESFATCTPLALDLLRKLYAKDGPIARAYQSLGVEVHHVDNFLALHGSLYVDSMMEIEQFFPAYTYGVSQNGMVPRIARWSGLWRTLENARHLSGLTPPHPRLMRERLARHVIDVEEVACLAPADPQKILELFIRVYQDVFLVNLYAEHVFRKTEKLLRHLPFPLVALLAIPLAVEKERLPFLRLELEKKMKGNSLNIGDESLFVVHQGHREVSPDVASWWGNLAGKKRNKIEENILRAEEYQQSREEGRELAVLLVSLLREALRAQSGLYEDGIYFATVEELIEKKVLQREAVRRKEVWKKEVLSDMPNTIATCPPTFARVAMGVSPGVASGVVVKEVSEISSDTILLAERLTPDLAPRLAEIKGIIAVEGGMLSHMAILAREAGVPVVIDQRAREKIKNGMKVTIDGEAGTITVQ